MRRRLRTLGILAVLAITTSLAVAWSCVLWSPLQDSRSLTEIEAAALISEYVGAVRDQGTPRGNRNDGPGWAVVFASDWTFPAPRRPRTSPNPSPSRRSRPSPASNAFRPMPRSPGDKQVEIFTAGWPVCCLEGQVTTTGSSRQSSGLVQAPALVRALGAKPRRRVPLRPRWGGLAVNTVFYGAVFWLAVPGSRALRRHRRRRRGQCPSCGYDVAHVEHDACPECGAAS